MPVEPFESDIRGLEAAINANTQAILAASQPGGANATPIPVIEGQLSDIHSLLFGSVLRVFEPETVSFSIPHAISPNVPTTLLQVGGITEAPGSVVEMTVQVTTSDVRLIFTIDGNQQGFHASSLGTAGFQLPNAPGVYLATADPANGIYGFAFNSGTIMGLPYHDSVSLSVINQSSSTAYVIDFVLTTRIVPQ